MNTMEPQKENLILSLALIFLLCSCTNAQSRASTTPDQIEFDVVDLETNINEMWKDLPCQAITVNKQTKFNNITGWLITNTKPGAKVYLTPIKNTTFENAREAIENCQPIWQSEIINGTFSFNYIPNGNYVAYTPISSYQGAWGPPVPHVFHLNHRINVSFHGGDSDYMASAFTLKSTNLN